jgi:hypothetical protein
MAEDRRSTPTEGVQRLYEDAEKHTAQAFEEVVAKNSFGELLARTTENIVGLTKLGTDAFDLVLRNLRLAGRQDVTRLARQLARTEDKLELVLQEVERLHEALHEAQSPSGSRSARGHASDGGSSNGDQSSGPDRAADPDRSAHPDRSSSSDPS